MKRTFIMLAVSSSLVATISGAVAQLAVVADQELMDKLKDVAPAAVCHEDRGDHPAGCHP